MYDKVLLIRCRTCNKEFYSEIIFKKGRMYCYMDCNKCRRGKDRYLESVRVYSSIYGDMVRG